MSYDHLGKWLIINVLVFLVAALGGAGVMVALDFALPGLLLAMLLALGTLVWLFASALALTQMLRELIESRDTRLRSFFQGLKSALKWRALYCFLHFSIGICILFAVAFYAMVIGTSLPWLGYGASAVALWALLFWALITLLLFPALVWKKEGYGAVLKLSALLVLDNPIFMLGIALCSLLLALATMMPPIVLLFSIVPQVILVSCAYEVLSRKYVLLEALPEDAKKRLTPQDWKDEEDDFLNRGVRDVIYPWKG